MFFVLDLLYTFDVVNMLRKMLLGSFLACYNFTGHFSGKLKPENRVFAKIYSFLTTDPKTRLMWEFFGAPIFKSPLTLQRTSVKKIKLFARSAQSNHFLARLAQTNMVALAQETCKNRWCVPFWISQLTMETQKIFQILIFKPNFKNC